MSIITTSDKASGGAVDYVDIPAPSGAAAGVFATVEAMGNGAGNLSMTGWTEDDTTTESVEGSVWSIFSKTLTGAEGSTYRVSNSTTGDRLTGIAKCHAGATGYDVAPGASYRNTYASYPSTMVAPGLTTGAALCVHHCVAGLDTTVGAFNSYPSGYTQAQLENSTGQHMASYYKEIASASATGDQSFGNDTGVNGYAASYSVAPDTSSIAQAAFAFGDDDGNEASHTLGTENTNFTGPANTAKTLRIQLNATGDPAAFDFDLYYDKDGAGSWAIMPIGASGASPGSVALDAASESHTGTTGATSTYSWTHTGGMAAPKGVIVCVYNRATGVYPASAVTYDGISLARITGGQAQDTTTGTEGGTVDVWFLGTGLSGAGAAPTVQVTLGVAGVACYAVCFTVDADGDTNYAGVISEQNNQTLTEENVDDGNTSGASLRVAFVLSGASAPPSAGTNSTAGPSIDFGAYANGSYYETTPGYGSRPVGASYGTSDDVAAIYLAITTSTTVNNDVYIDASSNISAGGADGTTNRLSTTGGTFESGARMDDVTGVNFNMTSDYQTEFEWKINTKSGLADSTYFEFRVYKSDAALGGGYTYTPKWTIGTAGGTVISRTLSDNVTTYDTMGPTRSKSRVLSDVANAVDAIARMAQRYRVLSDHAPTGNDALSKYVVRQRLLNEQIATVDALVRTARLTRSITDAITAGDTMQRMASLQRVLPDAVVTDDALARATLLSRMLSDDVSVADSLSASIQQGTITVISRVLSDSVSVADSVTRYVQLIRLLQDDAEILDTLSRSVGAPPTVLSRILSDSIETQDTLDAVRRVTRGLFDTIAVTDTIIRAMERVRTLVDNVDTYDDLRAQRDLMRSLGDFTDVYESMLREAMLVRVLSESLQLNDTMIRAIPTVVQAAIAIIVRVIDGTCIWAFAEKEPIVHGAVHENILYQAARALIALRVRREALVQMGANT